MKFFCNGCKHSWTTLDAEPNPPIGPVMRSCPSCLRKQGYRWVNVLDIVFEPIPEVAQ